MQFSTLLRTKRLLQLCAFPLQNVETATFVTKVMASDNDTEQNGVLEYAIMHGDMGKFVINSSSGHISTSGALNREERGLYTVCVCVCVCVYVCVCVCID